MSKVSFFTKMWRNIKSFIFTMLPMFLILFGMKLFSDSDRQIFVANHDFNDIKYTKFDDIYKGNDIQLKAMNNFSEIQLTVSKLKDTYLDEYGLEGYSSATAYDYIFEIGEQKNINPYLLLTFIHMESMGLNYSKEND